MTDFIGPPLDSSSPVFPGMYSGPQQGAFSYNYMQPGFVSGIDYASAGDVILSQNPQTAQSDISSALNTFNESGTTADSLPDYWSGLMASVGEQNAINRLYNSNQAEISRQFNSSEAEKNRSWLEKMSSTSYQRAVQDLQKAGLNPILAYSQGGASTPASSSATSQNASYNVGGGDTLGTLGSNFGNLLSSASNIFSAIGKLISDVFSV